MHEDALYDNVAGAYDVWAGQVLADGVLDDLISIHPGDRVCAIACGAGRDARYLAGRDALVTGVDLSANLIEIAISREAESPLGIAYHIDDAHNLGSLGDASFHGVLCHIALMDIPDLDRALQSIARILSAGGWFVFSITHPCFKPPAYGEIIDHVDGSVRRTVGKYFEEGPWQGPGARTDYLPSKAYHRTLSTYVNALTSAGFTIEQMREPQLDTPVWHEAACLLYVRCRKT